MVGSTPASLLTCEPAPAPYVCTGGSVCGVCMCGVRWTRWSDCRCIIPTHKRRLFSFRRSAGVSASHAPLSLARFGGWTAMTMPPHSSYLVRHRAPRSLPPSLIAQYRRVKRPWCPMATRQLLSPQSQQVRRRTLEARVAERGHTESIYFSRNLYARAFGGSTRITTGSQQLASLLRRYIATSVAQWSPTRRVLKAMDATGRGMAARTLL